MNGPSLQKTAVLSAVLHLTVFILSVLTIRHNSHFAMPSPYIVNLVSPVTTSTTNRSRASGSTSTQATVTSKAAAVKESKTIIPRARIEAKSTKIKELQVEDRIAELKAKKKIEQIVRLRSIISLSGSSEEGRKQTTMQAQTGGVTEGSLFDSYYSRITSEIWQEWVYPDTGDKGLETVVFVKIQRDGTITVQGVEKKSSNALFDRSALKAIAKASPVSPPPYEMEIGIRFHP